MKFNGMVGRSQIAGPRQLTFSAEVGQRFKRVAVAHEWLTVPGGSEQVVEQILRIFPHAELFTSVYDPAPWPPVITQRKVHASFLNRLPQARRRYPTLLPLMNRAFASFDLTGFDLIVSSNHACAKNVVAPPGALHICYCHTPMRYAWDTQFLTTEDLHWLNARAARLLLPRLRRQDFFAAQRPHAIAANSQAVAGRVARYWKRDARVIHPPVSVAHLMKTPRTGAGDYYLILGRVVPYKRVDLAVAACAALGRPVKVAGEGRALPAARAAAGPEAEFLGRVPDSELPALLAGARALLFPAEEDFGIVAVEAMAVGVPVIAYGVGGALDSITDGETGILFWEQTVDGLVQAIIRFERTEFDESTLRLHARKFAPERFREELAEFILSAE